MEFPGRASTGILSGPAINLDRGWYMSQAESET